jgi:nitrite reductase (NADH) small subunit
MTITTGLTSPASGTSVGSRATEVIAFERLPAERGVAALVDGEYVALFRIDDEVLAIDHVDPFTGSPVLARGIVASIGDRIVVASPLHKQRFDLRTGECLDDCGVTVRSWPVAVVDGRVLIGPAPPTRRP